MVARGEVEIGFQQVSEILPIEGVDYVGAIPEQVQKITTFSAGITVRALNPEGAERLIDFLSSPEVASTIAATGLTPVVTGKRPVGPGSPESLASHGRNFAVWEDTAFRSGLAPALLAPLRFRPAAANRQVPPKRGGESGFRCEFRGLEPDAR